MTNIVINDPSGYWTSNFVNSSDFASPTLTYRSATTLVISGSNGAAMTLTGNFTSSYYQIWTVNSISVSEYGVAKYTISDFSLRYWELDSKLGSSAMFTGDDSIISNMLAGSTYFTYGGNDTINVGSGNDTINGGTGVDKVIIDDQFADAEISMLGSFLQVDSADGIDRLLSVELIEFQDKTISVQSGSSGTNILTGNVRSGVIDDFIFAGSGNDAVAGMSGNDTLWGQSGNDTIQGNHGSDKLFGGDGNDSLLGGTGRDLLVGDLGPLPRTFARILCGRLCGVGSGAGPRSRHRWC